MRGEPLSWIGCTTGGGTWGGSPGVLSANHRGRARPSDSTKTVATTSPRENRPDRSKSQSTTAPASPTSGAHSSGEAGLDAATAAAKKSLVAADVFSAAVPTASATT